MGGDSIMHDRGKIWYIWHTDPGSGDGDNRQGCLASRCRGPYLPVIIRYQVSLVLRDITSIV